MWVACYTCLAVVLVVAFDNVNAQSYNNYYLRQYMPYRRPVVIISSGSGVRRTYVPPTIPSNEDTHTLSGARQDIKKVHLDLYYETDCPDSMRFITKQLYPLYQEMGDSLDINLVPYGKAYESYDEEKQRYTFRCQHGPMECYGNTVQSCAISLYPETKDHMDFINCMQSYPRPSRSGNKCARRLSLDWSKIDKCAKGEEGNRLLHKMAEQTKNLNPNLTFVPWIVVDKVYSDSNQRNAQRNLRGVVCEAYKGNHPSCRY